MLNLDDLTPKKVQDLLCRKAQALSKNGIDWRSRIASRFVLEVPKDFQPMPDGASLQYIEQAFKMGQAQRDKEKSTTDEGRLIAQIEALVQGEIAKSHGNERKLINEIGD